MNVQHVSRIGVWSRAGTFFLITNQTIHFSLLRAALFCLARRTLSHMCTLILLWCVYLVRDVSSQGQVPGLPCPAVGLCRSRSPALTFSVLGRVVTSRFSAVLQF